MRVVSDTEDLPEWPFEFAFTEDFSERHFGSPDGLMLPDESSSSIKSLAGVVLGSPVIDYLGWLLAVDGFLPGASSFEDWFDQQMNYANGTLSLREVNEVIAVGGQFLCPANEGNIKQFLYTLSDQHYCLAPVQAKIDGVNASLALSEEVFDPKVIGIAIEDRAEVARRAERQGGQTPTERHFLAGVTPRRAKETLHPWFRQEVFEALEQINHLPREPVDLPGPGGS